MANPTLIGFDIGSSSVKASLVDAEAGRVIAAVQSPDDELPLLASKPGWAEQDPDSWWKHTVKAAQLLKQKHPDAMSQVLAIGISYQMHGLVIVDKDYKPLRPSIIWCDSRAVEIGDKAFRALGEDFCLPHLLNSPGNFTASKLRWVFENEPEIAKKVHAAMLPGDYIALRMSGDAVTTPSGLSEGILWDFPNEAVAVDLLRTFEIPEQIIPKLVPNFGIQGQLRPSAAAELGLPAGIPISYRAGDQPNNAFALNVLNPGEIAATAGTSGVIYGVGDTYSYDPESRVNTFLHVNHQKSAPRLGTLLCINGTGILNSWLRRVLSTASSPNASAGITYSLMNEMGSKVQPGADGLFILPYGNGAERSLGNRNIGASMYGIQLPIHNGGHLARAVQEGIVFSLNYGLEILRAMKIRVETVRAGNQNLFLSPLFREIFAATTGATVELMTTDGASGAARAAGVGAKVYASPREANRALEIKERITPDLALRDTYAGLYNSWKEILQGELAKSI